MVLVRRFDPSGEELPRWEPLARDADGGIAFLSHTAARKAARRPVEDNGVAVGDLIAVVPAEAAPFPEEHAVELYTVTPDGAKGAPKPPKTLGGPWLLAWGQNIGRMTNVAKEARVDPRRVAMATCACARAHAGDGSDPFALAAVERWARAEATLDEAVAAIQAWADSPSADWLYDPRPFGQPTSVFEQWIPLPVVLLSALGYPDAIPFVPEPEVPCATPNHSPPVSPP